MTSTPPSKAERRLSLFTPRRARPIAACACPPASRACKGPTCRRPAQHLEKLAPSHVSRPGRAQSIVLQRLTARKATIGRRARLVKQGLSLRFRQGVLGEEPIFLETREVATSRKSAIGKMHNTAIRVAYINPEARLSFLCSSRDVQITVALKPSASNLLQSNVELDGEKTSAELC